MKDVGWLGIGVPDVSVASDGAEDASRAAPAHEDGQPRLDWSRVAGQRFEPKPRAAVVHDPSVQEIADEGERLGQPGDALAGTRPELQTERTVLALEPPGSKPEDRPPFARMVERDGHLGQETRIPEGVWADQRPQLDAPGRTAQCREGGPGLEDRHVLAAVDRQEVVGHPEGVIAEPVDEGGGRSEFRPVGRLTPQRDPETHQC